MGRKKREDTEEQRRRAHLLDVVPSRPRPATAVESVFWVVGALGLWCGIAWAAHDLGGAPWWMAALAAPWVIGVVIATILAAETYPWVLLGVPVAWAVGAWCAHDVFEITWTESVVAGPLVAVVIVVAVVLNL